jgi:hypothetical protein
MAEILICCTIRHKRSHQLPYVAHRVSPDEREKERKRAADCQEPVV